MAEKCLILDFYLGFLKLFFLKFKEKIVKTSKHITAVSSFLSEEKQKGTKIIFFNFKLSNKYLKNGNIQLALNLFN